MGRVSGMDIILRNTFTKLKVSKLEVDESGFLLPWQTKICKGYLYIQDTEIDPTYGGTRCVKVTRISDKIDGFEIDYSKVYEDADLHQVDSEEELSSGIMGGETISWIKIAPLPTYSTSQNSESVMQENEK